MELNKDIEKFERQLKTLEAKGVSFDKDAILEAKRLELVSHTSFSIKFIALLGGILGSFTLLGAIYAMNFTFSYVFNLVSALVVWAAAFWIHTKRKQIIYDTVLICLVLMASYFSYMVLNELDIDSTVNNSSLTLLIGGICLYFFNNELLAFLGSIGVLTALFFIILEIEVYWGPTLYLSFLIISTSFLFLKEAYFLLINSKSRMAYKPMRIAHILVMLGIVFYASSFGFLGSFKLLKILVLFVVYGCLFTTAYYMIREQKLTNKKHLIVAVLVGLLTVVPIYMNLGFGCSLLLVLLCFRAQYITGLLLSILSFCYFLFLFYYDLNYSLMIKSVLLMGTGLLFWGLYALMIKKMSRYEN